MNEILQIEGLSNIVLDTDLVHLFEPHGTVVTASVTANLLTGLCSGSGRIEMGSQAEARAATAALDGAEYLGRRLKVTGKVG